MNIKKILVTGGCGYIGSHIIVELIEAGYEVISIDNYSNSYSTIVEHIRQITNSNFANYELDICNYQELENVIKDHSDIESIIHMAAFKYVRESIEKPFNYYWNNVIGLLNVLKCMSAFNINSIVFSSSCTVYGNPIKLPVFENDALNPISPYGLTKYYGEELIKGHSLQFKSQVLSLRYFNPIGAHSSLLIGEYPKGIPETIIPTINSVAKNNNQPFIIHGNDYNTPDGTCVRDYVHVSDIAKAHILGVKYLLNNSNQSLHEVINLGSGKGYSVLEIINTFMEVNNLKFPYEYGPRRNGDVASIYASNIKAKTILGWSIQGSLAEMLKSSWLWDHTLP